MTTTPERQTATLSELVAQEIDSVRGRRRMSQAQLARAMGKTPMWVSLRLRGLQPIDMNDLLLFARVLNVGIHDLLPQPEVAARAVGPNHSSSHVDRSARHRSTKRRGDGPIGEINSPIGHGRRDSTRPVSAIPANRRRPTRVR